MGRRATRIGYAAGFLAVAAVVYWLLLGPLAGWLVGPDLALITPKERIDSISTARSFLAGVFASTVVVAGAIPTVVKLFDDREKQYTDRFNAAVTNLGSDHVMVRAGGIRALDRILHDSTRDRDRALRTVTGYLRNRAPGTGDGIPDDVAAALATIRERGRGRRPDPVDLRGAHLPGADLSGFDLRDADLSGADLTGADLTGANLGGARLRGTVCPRATLDRAVLRDASAAGLVLAGAVVRDAVLDGCDLTEADLTDTDLTGTGLAGAVLVGTRLQRADLRSTVGLTAEQLRRARTDPTTGLPPGLGA